MLKVTNATKQFSSGDTKVVAVKDGSIEVGNGKFVSIVGKSGSGKSTILALLSALDRLISGGIEDGETISPNTATPT